MKKYRDISSLYFHIHHCKEIQNCFRKNSNAFLPRCSFPKVYNIEFKSLICIFKALSRSDLNYKNRKATNWWLWLILLNRWSHEVFCTVWGTQHQWLVLVTRTQMCPVKPCWAPVQGVFAEDLSDVFQKSIFTLKNTWASVRAFTKSVNSGIHSSPPEINGN